MHPACHKCKQKALASDVEYATVRNDLTWTLKQHKKGGGTKPISFQWQWWFCPLTLSLVLLLVLSLHFFMSSKQALNRARLDDKTKPVPNLHQAPFHRHTRQKNVAYTLEGQPLFCLLCPWNRVWRKVWHRLSFVAWTGPERSHFAPSFHILQPCILWARKHDLPSKNSSLFCSISAGRTQGKGNLEFPRVWLVITRN